MLRWIPTFIFGPAEALETLALSLPVALWQHSVPTIGVTRKTATGLPGVTFKNRQHMITVPIRFTEAEWPAVQRLIEWGQTKAPFTWIPDSDPLGMDQLPSATVVLAAPRISDVVSPEPDGEYPRVMSVPLTFRQIVSGDES